MLDLLLPRICLLCRTVTQRESHLCEPCENELPILPKGCRNCADIVTGSALVCSLCLANPPPFDQTLACFPYEGCLPHLITQLKFRGSLPPLRFFQWAFLRKLRTHQPPPLQLIPLPLHPNRMKKRGFNQTLLLAKPLSKALGIRLDTQSLIRLKDTAPQSGLSRAERSMNIAHAFAITRPLEGAHIALLDDVMTTGQTLKAAAATLKTAGANTVDVWCIARRMRTKVAE